MNIQLYREFRIWRDLVPWLIEHCGPVLHSRPIMQWHARNWGLSYVNPHCWQVRIDDDRLAMLFLLRWA